MLEDLPPDCLRLVVGHLPTASSVISLALASRELYSRISADDYAILRDFVQNAFPSIRATPPWRDAAISLTSRSRAWDRKAFIARECWNTSADWKKLSSTSKHGFVPVIDSYESSSFDSGHPQKEVLAHSAAGRIMLRVNHGGSYSWREVTFPDDHQAENDMLDLYLLRPNQHSVDGESIVFRRANGQVAKVESLTNSAVLSGHTIYDVSAPEVDCIAVSRAKMPTMTVCSSKTLRLYDISNSERTSTASFRLSDLDDAPPKARCAKYLFESLIALSRGNESIEIYDVNATPLGGDLVPAHTISDYVKGNRGRRRANVMVPLENSGRSSSSLLLTGWTDGVVRLYDLKSPQRAVATFRDSVDDGQIMSLLPVGQEKFFAGSSQNACLKTYDLRLPGMRPYSHNNTPSGSPRPQSRSEHSGTPRPSSPQLSGRDVNIFVAPRVNTRPRTWFPVSQSASRNERYRGAIYSLSSPSPTSSTIYAGITDHVMQLDFVSTDDIYKDGTLPSNLDIPRAPDTNMLHLSCYERPRQGRESTDTVLLRHQRPWNDVVAACTDMNGDSNGRSPGRLTPEPGWDERWIPPGENGPGRWRRGKIT